MSEFEKWMFKGGRGVVVDGFTTGDLHTAFEAGQSTLPQEVKDVIDAAKRWLGVDINDTTALDISYDDLRDAINSYEEATSD